MQPQVAARELRAAISVLTPRGRVVFVLREAFGWPYRHSGELLGSTEAHVRQITRHARLWPAVPPGPLPAAEPRAARVRLLRAFLEVSRTGDPAALVAPARGDR